MALPYLMLAAIAIGLGATYALTKLFPNRFLKTNFQGKRIPTAFGLVLVIATVIYIPRIASYLTIDPDNDTTVPFILTAVVGFGILGLIDDIFGDRTAGGFKGHFKALLKGRVTTGAIKAIGGVAIGIWIGRQIEGNFYFYCIVDAIIIAGTANILNLLDLRPGRSLTCYGTGTLTYLAIWAILSHDISTFTVLDTSDMKFGLLCALVLYLFEARGVVMLGDTGANSFGALLGVAYASMFPRNGQVVLAILIIAFHIWTEKHSASKFIESHPTLRALDSKIGVR